MKVLALIYGDEAAWDALHARSSAGGPRPATAPSRAGAAAKIVDGAELAPTRTATTVRVRDGADRRHRRPVRRDEGSARRLLPARLRRLSTRRPSSRRRSRRAATGAIELRAGRTRRKRHEVPPAPQQRQRDSGTRGASFRRTKARSCVSEALPRWNALFDWIGEQGIDVNGLELDDPAKARVVQVRDGQTAVTDGPVRRDEGGARRLLPRRLQGPRPGDRARGARARSPAKARWRYGRS